MIGSRLTAGSGRWTDLDGNQVRWLGRCVGDPEHFLGTSWGRAPWVHRGSPDQFDKVFSSDELNRLLAMGIIPSAKVRMVSQGRLVPDRAWAAEEKRTLVPDSKRIARLAANGYTLTIRQIEQYAPGLAELCAGLRAELSHPVGMNLFFTQSSSQGFGPHYDPHDAFVLQLEGEKDWQVFNRASDRPQHATNVTLASGECPVLVARLTPGDSLYVPRGFAHSAAAADSGSLHVTIGIYAASVTALLRYVLSESAPSQALATALPPGFAARPEELRTLLASGVQALCEELADPARLDGLADGFCRDWPGEASALQ
jgi:lysine-specific demethylase/histidyl-hydroxylase NO66